jgi:hypothetical protein
MNELLRELEADIRNEKLQRLWHSFGKMMIAASIVIIVVTIGVVIWQEHEQSVAAEQTSQFIKGLDRLNVEDYRGAIAVFGAMTKDDDSPYYGMAMLRKAQAEALSGDKDAALATYQALARHDGSGHNAAFVDLGKMLAADNKTLVEPKKGSPLYYTQSEWKGWQLMQQGKKQDAAKIFLALRDDENTPATLRERMVQVLQYVAPEAAEKSAKAAGDE